MSLSVNVSEKAALIWAIADKLTGVYKPHEYGEIILPLTVLRRFDCILADTKDKVVEKYESVKDIAMKDILLRQASQHDFYNTSKYTFEKLLDDPDNIEINFRDFINGFSQNVLDIYDNFRFDNHITKMAENGILYLVVKEFTTPRANLHPSVVSNLEMGYIFEEIIRRFSEAHNEDAGQHYTPREVIRLMVNILFNDENQQLSGINVAKTIYDPACGTGGFIIQCLIELKDRYPSKEKEISRWAQLHIYGIDKDAIGIKLTKAIMQILGDGSAHCVRGDSVLTHTWRTKYPHLLTNSFKDGRFTKVFTNPPFGAPLKVKYTDAKKAGLSIVDYIETGKDIELGLAMFNRCCDLLKPGGKICIVLPETYFFSPSYKYVREWVKERLKPVCVAYLWMHFKAFVEQKQTYIFLKGSIRIKKILIWIMTLLLL